MVGGGSDTMSKFLDVVVTLIKAVSSMALLWVLFFLAFSAVGAVVYLFSRCLEWL